MFSCKACEAYRREVAFLSSQLSDLQALLQDTNRAREEERKQLLDRILVLTNPAALMNLRAGLAPPTVPAPRPTPPREAPATRVTPPESTPEEPTKVIHYAPRKSES